MVAREEFMGGGGGESGKRFANRRKLVGGTDRGSTSKGAVRVPGRQESIKLEGTEIGSRQSDVSSRFYGAGSRCRITDFILSLLPTPPAPGYVLHTSSYI